MRTPLQVNWLVLASMVPTREREIPSGSEHMSSLSSLTNIDFRALSDFVTCTSTSEMDMDTRAYLLLNVCVLT